MLSSQSSVNVEDFRSPQNEKLFPPILNRTSALHKFTPSTSIHRSGCGFIQRQIDEFKVGYESVVPGHTGRLRPLLPPGGIQFIAPWGRHCRSMRKICPAKRSIPQLWPPAFRIHSVSAPLNFGFRQCSISWGYDRGIDNERTPLLIPRTWVASWNVPGFASLENSWQNCHIAKIWCWWKLSMMTIYRLQLVKGGSLNLAASVHIGVSVPADNAPKVRKAIYALKGCVADSLTLLGRLNPPAWTSIFQP